MPKYRVHLDRIITATDLVTGGDFPDAPSFAANWGTSDAGWAFNVASGGIARKAALPSNFLRQPNVFTLGRTYSVTYTLAGLAVNTGLFIGDYGNISRTVNGTFTEIRKCLAGTELAINSGGVDVDNVSAFEMVYNAPLVNEPKNLIGGEITLERNRGLNALFRSWTNQLVFWGDGYDFIKAKAVNDFCDTIEVLIEIECADGDGFEDFFEGVIYLTDVEFNDRECEVTAVVEDRSASAILVNEQNIRIGLDPNNLTFGFLNFLPDPRVNIDFHDDTGAYPVTPPYVDTFSDGSSINVGLALRRIVHFISGVNVEFASDVFLSAGAFVNLIMKWGANIRSDIPAVQSTDQYIEVLTRTWKEMFDELNKVFNLQVNITTPNNVPTINLVERVDLFGAANLATLNNVVNPSSRFYIEEFYKTVTVGYKREFKTDEGGIQYFSEDTCTKQDLDLVSKLVTGTDILWELLAGEDLEIDSIRNGTFDNNGDQWIPGVGWIISGGGATHAPGGGASFLAQTGVTKNDCEFDSSLAPACRYEFTFTISSFVAGTITPQLGANAGTARAANGTFTEIIVADINEDNAGFTNTSSFDGIVDNVKVIKFKAKETFDDDVFLVETDGSQTSQFGVDFHYNDNLEQDKIIDRWIATLQGDFVKIRDTKVTITKTNTALTKIFSFTHPIDKATWDLIIADLSGKITFNSPENGIVNTEGFISKIVRQNDGGKSDIELITEQ